jgi:formylglycine-generating enzyme required for sulfatase activity
MTRVGLALRAGWTLVLILSTTWIVRAASGDRPNTLSFVGSLASTTPQSAPSAVDLTFRFSRAGAPICAPTVRAVKPESTSGNVRVSIPLDDCAGFLDGSDTTVDVLVGANVVVSDKPMAATPRAKYAGTRGSPECPAGYARASSGGAPISCRRGHDEVVKVAAGAAAFWIDRYEAGVFAEATGEGAQYGVAASDYPAHFPADGDHAQPLYAVSRSGITPSRYLTWFQANEACRASGKRLPTHAEWHRAARGTPDPGASDGAADTCVTLFGGPRATGGARCQSAWGAQDMIGNAAEWTLRWQSMVGDASAPPDSSPQRRSDGTWNVTSQTVIEGTTREVGPAIAVAGGSYLDGTAAGIRALDFRRGPGWHGADVGFRCVVSR